MSSGVSPSPKAEVPPSSMGGSPALVGPLPGPSGTALINLAFATNPSNLVQGTGSLPMPPQVVPPQMTTITRKVPHKSSSTIRLTVLCVELSIPLTVSLNAVG